MCIVISHTYCKLVNYLIDCDCYDSVTGMIRSQLEMIVELDECTEGNNSSAAPLELGVLFRMVSEC